MTIEPKCTCCARQLYHVGCDCLQDIFRSDPSQFAKVRVWLDGYASNNTATFYILNTLTDADATTETRRRFAGFARVDYIERPRPPIAPVSEAYARAMSQHDNS